MKLIQWNCQGAFRKKNRRILNQLPDIITVCECENEERLKFGELTPNPNSFLWFGSNPHKGIGIFSYSDYTFELHKSYNPECRYVIPLKVKNENDSFILLAIWAMENKNDSSSSYVGQIWNAINHYTHLLNETIILIGDFNSNKIWDKKYRVGDHSDVVEKLNEYGVVSLYHEIENVEQGEEPDPTFFLQKKIEKPYHIDYCFASKDILKNGFEFKVGAYDDWIDVSDHVPIVAVLKTRAIRR